MLSLAALGSSLNKLFHWAGCIFPVSVLESLFQCSSGDTGVIIIHPSPSQHTRAHILLQTKIAESTDTPKSLALSGIRSGQEGQHDICDTIPLGTRSNHICTGLDRTRSARSCTRVLCYGSNMSLNLLLVRTLYIASLHAMEISFFRHCT